MKNILKISISVALLSFGLNLSASEDYSKLDVKKECDVKINGLDKVIQTADIARFGSDKARIAVWNGWTIIDVISFDISKTTEIQNAINHLRRKYKIPLNRCIADEDGVGGGVVDNCGIIGFTNNGKPFNQENYSNLQSQCAYQLAEQINESNVGIDCELSEEEKDEITTELQQLQTHDADSDGKLKIKPKELIKQDIEESGARIDEILAKITSEKQQYYIGKAHEEALKASKLLSEAAAAKTDEERKVLAIQQHVLFKEVDKMVAEIEGVGLDNDQKKIIKNSLQKSLNSHIYLNTAQAMAAEANAKFSNENIKTIEGQLQLWSKQAENWEGQRENVKRQIEEQVKQWAQENMFEGGKVELERTRIIADIILRGLESVQKIGQIVGTTIIK